MDLKGAEVASPPEAKAAAAAKAPKASTEGNAKGSKEMGPKGAQEKGPKKRRGVFSWFFAGIGLAIATICGLASWNVWSDPHYVISPRLDALTQDFGGYVAATAQCEADKAPEVIRITQELLSQAAQGQFSAEEIARAKSKLINAEILNKTSSRNNCIFFILDTFIKHLINNYIYIYNPEVFLIYGCYYFLLRLRHSSLNI